MLVCKLAREQVTVALSGDGGDEFYCGYNIYEKVAQAQKLDTLGGLVHNLCNLPGIRQAGLEKRLPFKARVIAGNRDRETKTQFGAGKLSGDGARHGWQNGFGGNARCRCTIPWRAAIRSGTGRYAGCFWIWTLTCRGIFSARWTALP